MVSVFSVQYYFIVARIIDSVLNDNLKNSHISVFSACSLLNEKTFNSEKFLTRLFLCLGLFLLQKYEQEEKEIFETRSTFRYRYNRSCDRYANHIKQKQYNIL